MRAKEKVFPNNWGFIKRFFLKKIPKEIDTWLSDGEGSYSSKKIGDFSSFMNERIKAYYST
jgi:hypothetical protein